MKRPSLQKLFDRLEEFDLVLVYKLDRLTRNVRDLLEMLEVFEKNNIAFKSAKAELFDKIFAYRQVIYNNGWCNGRMGA